ncbi:hypothetical protein OXYTRIMIC_474 [Oxytricha trifallax]|uniref:Uncharacterized protein n=1 Tax=Oxytricha trifallax TaxID=1172189 RepID=A0A073HYN4_9SPIT|nr:hypothetical protein OXYTRIMIC_474 [Oxytricha trifallax]
MVNSYNKYVNAVKVLIEKHDSFNEVLEIIEEIDYSEVFGVKQHRITYPPIIQFKQFCISSKQNNCKDQNSSDSLAEFVHHVDQTRTSEQEQYRETPVETIKDVDCSMDQNKNAIADENLFLNLYREFDYVQCDFNVIIMVAKFKGKSLQRSTIQCLKEIRKLFIDNEKNFIF